MLGRRQCRAQRGIACADDDDVCRRKQRFAHDCLNNFAKVADKRPLQILRRRQGAGVPRIMSDAFSAIMIVGALVLHDGMNGMTEASTTRKPSSPRSRGRASRPRRRPAPSRRFRPDDGRSCTSGRRIAPASSSVSSSSPGQALGEHEGLQRRLAQDLAREPQAFERAFAIVRIGPVVGIDQRRGFRIGAREAHGSARARAQESGIERDARIAHLRDARLDPRAEAEVKLNVGRARGLVGVPEAAGLEQRRGRPGPVLNKRYWTPAQIVRCESRDPVIGVVAGAFRRWRRDRDGPAGCCRRREDRGRPRRPRLQRVGRPDAGELQAGAASRSRRS